MTKDVYEALGEMRRVRGFVFPMPEDQWIHRVTLNAIHRICKRTGVRPISWHILRYTFASHLTMEGIPIPVIQQLLGHASIVMTMRYTHLSPSKLNEAIAVLDTYENEKSKNLGNRWATPS